ncbi:CCD81 protein, partial [Alectura lathami]|nr:CCD81 protein [Alectura lathami]
EICKVWAATSRYIRRQLLQKKVVDIAIGKFAVVPARTTTADGNVLAFEKPVFQLCRMMKKFYRLKCPKVEIPVHAVADPLNFEEIAEDIHFRPPIVEQCVHETLLFFADALRNKKEVDFFFK